jgi:hypothetical protein
VRGERRARVVNSSIHTLADGCGRLAAFVAPEKAAPSFHDSEV